MNRNLPTNKILIGNLTADITDETIEKTLVDWGIDKDDISKIGRDQPKTEALVELSSIDAAQFIIDQYYYKKKQLQLDNRVATIQFGASNNTESSNVKEASSPRDLGTGPNPLVLINNVPTHVSAAELFDFLQELAPSDIKDSVVNMFLIKSRRTRESCGYAVAEFGDTVAASRFIKSVYADPTSACIYGNILKFRFSHEAAFVELPHDSNFVARILENDAEKVYYEYWDEHRYASVFPWSAAERIAANPHCFFGTCKLQDSQEPSKVKEPQHLKLKKQTRNQIAKWSKQSRNFEELPRHAVWTLSELEALLPADEHVSQIHLNLEICACLLCKRGFAALDQLEQHVQLSVMHKDNLSAWKLAQLNVWKASLLGKPKVHRNRALEIKSKLSLADLHTMRTESQSAPAIDTPPENKGSLLLKKMGWKEGEGLGKNATGIAEPIKAELNLRKGAGLGCEKLQFDLSDPNARYKAIGRLATLKRFSENPV